jgi:hypothetical protein
MLAWFAALAATLAVCILLGRHNRARVVREWDMSIGRRRLEDIEALERRCRLDRMMADDSWEMAWEAMTREQNPEVLRLLDLACQVLESASADRLVRLRGVRVCARMAAALAPPPPLVPRDFRLPEIRTVAGAARLVHAVVISSMARFVLKARVIAFGFSLSVRAMRRAKRDESVRDALVRFDAAKADWKTLDVEHVEMVRMLIVSLAATRRAESLAR